MEKRSIIVIIIVFIILLVWPLMFNRKKQSTPIPPKKQEIVQKKEESPKSVISETKIIKDVPKDSIITVETPLYSAKLTTDGARIISWQLKDYANRGGEPGNINLILSHAQNCLVLQFDDPKIQKEIENKRWMSDKKAIILENGANETISFTNSISSGINIIKKMTFYSDNYIVDVDINFLKPSKGNASIGKYSILWGPGIAEDELISPQELANDGPITLLITEKSLKIIKHWQRSGFGCFGGKQVRIPAQDGPILWTCFASKYFTTVLIPNSDPWWSAIDKAGSRYRVETSASETSASPKDVWKNWGNTTTIGLTVPPTISQDQSFRVYIGPKKWEILRNIKRSDNPNENLRLGKLIDFGTFSVLGKATLWLIQLFYKVGKNYGVSIILVSVLIKILYLPLTQKSFNSMNKMQELQPKIAALREKYRDDPQRLNKETMKIYKQHGASPLGGCLPLLLQIPVFWALFSTLRGAVELRGAVFINGWINDLSLPDTVASISGFPIRILPLLMTGSALAQQLIFGTGSPGQSNKTMALMPVFMLFIFYGMPSGLVLYWLCNDIFSFGHRYLIKHLQEGKDKSTENEGKARNENKAKTKELINTRKEKK
ncbi:MAG: membrane protein insertase YidC, partial [bacterium]